MHIKKNPYLSKLVNKHSVSSKSCSSAAESEVLNASKYEAYKTKQRFTSVKSEIKKSNTIDEISCVKNPTFLLRNIAPVFPINSNIKFSFYTSLR